MVCFYVNLHKFCTKSRLFLFGPFSRSSIFASEIAFLAFFPYRVLLQIHSYNFGFCNISQIWLYLHSLMVQISLYLFCDVKNSQFLDLCSKITNRRQIDEKQPTWILSLSSVWPKWTPLLGVNLLHIAMIKLGAANISDSISEAEAFWENWLECFEKIKYSFSRK